MSTIQNIKNFIRGGGKAQGHGHHQQQPTTGVSNVTAHSEPNVAHHNKGMTPAQQIPADFSLGGGDNRNIAAKAADVAAHVASQNQKKHKAAAEKNVDPQVLERIIAEEREAKGKLPKYPGLERWKLLEKMGDGAFSNVYRAEDTQGQYEQVAIKVVRKFEMNSSQVRNKTLFLFIAFLSYQPIALAILKPTLIHPYRAIKSCIQMSSPRK